MFVTRFSDVEAFPFAVAAMIGVLVVNPTVAAQLPGTGASILSGLAGLAAVSGRCENNKLTGKGF
ncbi:hypothetical protein [Roseibium album]|uniref:hypothetical protein n=1 Tax=Roseibium album TaxID=311410 RepID=UPI00248FAA73|nr:hypothetical protein [Roseibium album]